MTAKLQQTKDELNRFFSEQGRYPNSDEYDKISRGGLDRPYQFMALARLKHHAGHQDYYEALKVLGFEGTLPALSGRIRHKVDSLGLKYRPEFPVCQGGRTYRIDYQIFLEDNTCVFLEVDGESHWNANSIYHMRNSKGLSPQASLAAKIARDAIIDSFCDQSGISLVRIEFHRFLNMSKGALLLELRGQLGSRSNPDQPLFDKAQALLNEGKSKRQTYKTLGVGDRTFNSWLAKGWVTHSPDKNVGQVVKENLELIRTRLFEESKTMAEVAKELGVPPKLFSFNCPWKIGMQNRAKRSEQLRGKVAIGLETGTPLTQIAKDLGISYKSAITFKSQLLGEQHAHG